MRCDVALSPRADAESFSEKSVLSIAMDSVTPSPKDLLAECRAPGPPSMRGRAFGIRPMGPRWPHLSAYVDYTP